MLEIEVEGLTQYRGLLGLAAEAFSPADLELAIEGAFRETRLPSGDGVVMDERLTLAGAIEDQFETGGRNAYHPRQWRGYDREPVYAYLKRKQGGGRKVGTWDGSKRPLSRSMTEKGDPDHVEFVDHLGGMFGSHRGYAGTFSVGGPLTPFDKVPQPARIIQPITDPGDRFALEVARALQRILSDRLAQAPGEPGVPLPRVSP